VFLVSPKLSKAEAGAIGARRRWGPQRIVRLDELTVEQRRVVLALIEAAKAANATVERSTDPPDRAA